MAKIITIKLTTAASEMGNTTKGDIGMTYPASARCKLPAVAHRTVQFIDAATAKQLCNPGEIHIVSGELTKACHGKLFIPTGAGEHPGYCGSDASQCKAASEQLAAHCAEHQAIGIGTGIERIAAAIAIDKLHSTHSQAANSDVSLGIESEVVRVAGAIKAGIDDLYDLDIIERDAIIRRA